jgi:hypothetical protein
MLYNETINFRRFIISVNHYSAYCGGHHYHAAKNEIITLQLFIAALCLWQFATLYKFATAWITSLRSKKFSTVSIYLQV